ncbi:MAG: tetratricopeptide repeat protein [Acidobacteriota bacterium]
MKSVAWPRMWLQLFATTSREDLNPRWGRLPALFLAAVCCVLSSPSPSLPLLTATAARKQSGELKNTGIRAYKKGRLSRAIEDLAAAININLNDFFAHFYLGLALKDVHRYPEARRVLEIAAELDPRYLQVYVALGEVALRDGDPDTARAWYQKALNRQDRYAPALDGLGQLAESRGDLVAAVDRYRQAIKSNRGFPQPYVHLGAIYRRQGRTLDAIDLFREAIRFRPDLAAGYRFLGIALGDLGRRTEAISLLQKALELEPESVETHLAMGRLMSSWDDRVRAREQFQKARGLRPEDIEALTGLADLARREGAYERAQALLDAALAMKKLDEGTRLSLLTLKTRYRQEAAALEQARARLTTGAEPAAEDAGHQNGLAHLRLARLRATAGDRPAAFSHCRSALEEMPHSGDLLFECGFYALKAGQDGEAVTLLQKAAAADPTEERILIDLGLAYTALGRLTSAADSYRRARAINSASVEASLYLGNTLYRLGKILEAAGAYREALRSASSVETIDRIQKILEQLEEQQDEPAASPPAAGAGP